MRMTMCGWWLVPVFALCGCGAAPDRDGSANAGRGIALNADTAPAAPSQAAAAASTPAADTAADAKPAEPLSCAAELGAAAAAKRVATCVQVSPATHPPCNAANSCAQIEDEIARSCALFDGKGAPMAGCGPAPKSPEAAAAVVQRYYSAIDARDYDVAWRQWGEEGRPGQSLAAFKAGFAHTRSTKVTIGTLAAGDAGAGSLYQPVPVTVEATLDDGTQQRFQGTYTLRSVNDVDGASAEQLRWHIGSAQLKEVSAD